MNYWETVSDAYWYKVEPNFWIYVRHDGLKSLSYGISNIEFKILEKDVPEEIVKSVREYIENPFFEIELAKFKSSKVNK
jgi:hypothetical protein